MFSLNSMFILFCRFPEVPYRSLTQLSLGVLGLGNIGKCIAKYCKALGMTIWGIGRTERKELPVEVDEYRTMSGLGEMLQSCDYICNVLPSTPETKGLLSGDVLQACQSKQACFINIGRGDVIDTASIVKALKNGWISHAILDVFEEEPLPQNSELWDMPGVTITPHCCGRFFPNQVCALIYTFVQCSVVHTNIPTFTSSCINFPFICNVLLFNIVCV